MDSNGRATLSRATRTMSSCGLAEPTSLITAASLPKQALIAVTISTSALTSVAVDQSGKNTANQHELSPGAKAGMIVGVSLFILLVALLGIARFKIRQRKKETHALENLSWKMETWHESLKTDQIEDGADTAISERIS